MRVFRIQIEKLPVDLTFDCSNFSSKRSDIPGKEENLQSQRWQVVKEDSNNIRKVETNFFPSFYIYM